MKKITLGLLVLLGLSLSADLYSACELFSFHSKGGLSFKSKDDATKDDDKNAAYILQDFMTFVKVDAAQLDSIYLCLVKEAKNLKNETDKVAAYGTAFNRVVTLEAEAKAFKEVIDKANETLKATTGTVAARIVLVKNDNSTMMSKYSKGAETTAKNLAKLASGINAEYVSVKDSADAAVAAKDKITEQNKAYKDKYGTDASVESLLGKNKDKEDDEIKLSLEKTEGGYEQNQTGADKYTADMTAGKFSIVSVEPSNTATNTTTPSNTSTQKPTMTPVNTTTTDTAAAGTKDPDADTKALLTAMLAEEKKKAANPVTTVTTPSSDKGGSSGSGEQARLGGGFGNYDADRAKRAEEMANRQRQQKIKEIIREAKTRTKFPKSSNLSFQRDKAGGSSLFGTKSKDDDDIDKKSKPSIFDKMDKKGTTSKKGDYSSYYGTVNLPGDLSSKELAMNRFSSMYEMARRKTLIEDARSEFAGRYIDIFLLQHSIIYDYYSKGMLVDIAEAVLPIGDQKRD